MAIYKRITDLDTASQPLGGTEYAELSQGGVSKKATLTSIFGAGWWTNLRAAFASFVAPEATHALDCDTVDGDSLLDLHDAAQLTGNIHLDRIPVELTGKNAATATLATTATLANTAGTAEWQSILTKAWAYTPGDKIIFYERDKYIDIGSTSYTFEGQNANNFTPVFCAQRSGTIRLTWFQNNASGSYARSRIYKNGVAVGIEHRDDADITVVEDVDVLLGDVVRVYGLAELGGSYPNRLHGFSVGIANEI